MAMTPLSYSFLQDCGFKLLIPIISQNGNPPGEALNMWGKEVDKKFIRLEHHTFHMPGKTDNAGLQQASNVKNPFSPEGLKVFIGESGEMDLQYEGTIFYEEELMSFLQSS
jgi:hypothetical protein